MQIFRVIVAAVVLGLLAGCGRLPFWESSGDLFVTRVEVIPNPVPAGSIVRIHVETKDTRTGPIPAIVMPTYVTVSAGTVFGTREHAETGQSVPSSGEGSPSVQCYGDAWWVAPDTAQQATVHAEYGRDKKTMVVSVVSAQ